MEGRYQAYPEYKDSNYRWLGKVPCRWRLLDGKRVFSNRREVALVNDEQLAASQKYGVVPQTLMMDLYESKVMLALKGTSSFRHVEKGDFVISLRSFEGGIEHSDYMGCVSPAYTVLKPDGKISADFYRYFFKSRPYITALQSTTDSLRDGKSITYQQFGGIPLVLPSLQEQQQITNFLDHETTKIDTLIEKQQQLIALLKEKRQAVISHAVTKGLNPDAPMKDSGVEWLGEVPAHWTVCRLKHLKSKKPNSFVDGPFGSNLKSEHFMENGDIYVIESNFATTGKIETSKLKTISKEHFDTIKRSSTTGGDIIIAKIGARYGSSSILPELDKKAVVSGNSLKLTVDNKSVVVEYANELLRVLKDRDVMDDGVNVTAQPALSLGGLNNIPFLKVPLKEQAEIVDFIRKVKEKYDLLVQNANQFIALAMERRTALISAAVTGKIDVRNWQPPTDKDIQ
ncbi:MAG: restriction endonuclease subunit S [Desulfamplus sp.]|nr:restriction endonuclease subunit S [Desulfamplus sp.]